jgi:uncharacterized RDD family membrane protein YckC
MSPPPGGVPPSSGGLAAETGPGGRQLASFGSRLLAFLIDGLVGAAFTLPGYVIGAGDSTALDLIGGLLVIAGSIAFIVLYCKKVAAGHSWGQQVAKVQVVNATSGALLSPMQVFVRQLCKIISSFVCYLGFLWMIWDPKKQTWHDKIVTTQVVVG